jgi:hypothetical protein
MKPALIIAGFLALLAIISANDNANARFDNGQLRRNADAITQAVDDFDASTKEIGTPQK